VIAPGMIGLVGVLVFCCGVHLLWLSREEVLGWMERFFRTFRTEYTRRGGLEQAGAGAASRAERSEGRTLRLVGSFVLLFLGPTLVLVEVALRVWPR